MIDKPKILLADDDVEDRFILTSSFDMVDAQIEVDCVSNGVEVMSFLESISDNSLPSLIILDLNMPKISGTETLRLIKQQPRFQNIPIIIFSTSINIREKEECMKLGATSYVTKPNQHAEGLQIAKYFEDICYGRES